MLAVPLQTLFFRTSTYHLISLCLFFLFVLFVLSISMSLMHRVVLRTRRLRPTPPHIALRPPVLAADASTWYLFKQGAFGSQYPSGPRIVVNAFGSSYDTVPGHVFMRNLEASEAQSPPTDPGGTAASKDTGETRFSEYPTCPQTDGHLLVTEKEGGNCLNASIRNLTDDANEVANVATPKPARPVEEQFSKLNALPDDDCPTRTLSGAVPCRLSAVALPPQVVKQNSAGVADPATNKLNHRQESLAVIKYVPAPAYSSLFTARNAKEADGFRENGGDVASITTWQHSDDRIHGQDALTLPLTLLGKESEGGTAADVGSDGDSSASSEDIFAACEALGASSLTPGASGCTSEEKHEASDAGEIIGTLVASDDTFAQPDGPSGHSNAGAGKSDITNSKTATTSVKSGDSVELEVATPSPSAATCDVGRAPCSELPQRADASICPTSVLSEPSSSPCSDKIEKSTGDVDGVPTASDAVTSKAGGDTEGGETQGTSNGAQTTAGKGDALPNGSALVVILVSAKPKEVKKEDYSFLDLAYRNSEQGDLTRREGTDKSKRRAKSSLIRARYFLRHETQPPRNVPKPVLVGATPSDRARVPSKYCAPAMEHRSMQKEAWFRNTLRKAYPYSPAVPSPLTQRTESRQSGQRSPKGIRRASLRPLTLSSVFYRSPKRSVPGKLLNRAIVNWRRVGPEERAMAIASRAIAIASESEPAETSAPESRVQLLISPSLSREQTSPAASATSRRTYRPSGIPVPKRRVVSSAFKLPQAFPTAPLSENKENRSPMPANRVQRPTLVASRLPLCSPARQPLRSIQSVVNKTRGGEQARLAISQGVSFGKDAKVTPVRIGSAKPALRSARENKQACSDRPATSTSPTLRHDTSSAPPSLRRTTIAGKQSASYMRSTQASQAKRGAIPAALKGVQPSTGHAVVDANQSRKGLRSPTVVRRLPPPFH